ncbi:MAG: hypothetical protein QN127_04235 [Armatimonadota bacterium]|nr:hypothetical protein [Armatimonadota bacterium]
MITDSWLQPHLLAVLKKGLPVLRRWRSQANLQGRIKNFENWLLVELNYQLLESGDARVVLTNGFFAEGQDIPAPKRVQSKDVPGLRGRKARATYISADLSVRPSSAPGEYWIAELKTGITPVELQNDLRLVRFYREGGIATRAELGWVVLLPEPERVRVSCEDSLKKIRSRLQSDGNGWTLQTERIEDWLVASVVVPTTNRPPNMALEPAAQADDLVLDGWRGLAGWGMSRPLAADQSLPTTPTVAPDPEADGRAVAAEGPGGEAEIPAGQVRLDQALADALGVAGVGDACAVGSSVYLTPPRPRAI